MKARLIRYQDSIQLLLCTGKIKNFSNYEACEFLLNFSDSKYYSDNSKWDFENLSMTDYKGDTIAYVCDETILHIVDAKLFKDIFENKESNYITAKEYADAHGKQPAIIRRLCQHGRIRGSIQKGKTWLIPANSPYPSDERIKE